MGWKAVIRERITMLTVLKKLDIVRTWKQIRQSTCSYKTSILRQNLLTVNNNIKIGINVSRIVTLIHRHRLAMCIIVLMRLALANIADKIIPTSITMSQTADVQAMDKPRKVALLPSKVMGIMAQATRVFKIKIKIPTLRSQTARRNTTPTNKNQQLYSRNFHQTLT
jgi:hypothetical protein